LDLDLDLPASKSLRSAPYKELGTFIVIAVKVLSKKVKGDAADETTTVKVFLISYTSESEKKEIVTQVE
jgi:hypothetical protein